MYFRYGFYSEAVISISHMDSLPVEQADTNSEEIFIDICQVRNIVGILASCIGFYLVVCLLYHFFQLSECYFFIHRSFLFFYGFTTTTMVEHLSFYRKILFLSHTGRGRIFQFFQFGDGVVDVAQ